MSITPEQRAILGDTVLNIVNPSADVDAIQFNLRNNLGSRLCAIHTSLGWAEMFHEVEAFEAASIDQATAEGRFDPPAAPVVVDQAPVDAAPTIAGVTATADTTAPTTDATAPTTDATTPTTTATSDTTLADFTAQQFAQNNPPADGAAQ